MTAGEEEDDGRPGFGAVAALVGLSVALLAARRRV
ncbi:PGF-CTERM sorting domain-containing protein [Halovivax sp.]|nr:PGF-CTERM sorting domain-containing protein [Halovivax sp.]